MMTRPGKPITMVRSSKLTISLSDEAVQELERQGAGAGISMFRLLRLLWGLPASQVVLWEDGSFRQGYVIRITHKGPWRLGRRHVRRGARRQPRRVLLADWLMSLICRLWCPYRAALVVIACVAVWIALVQFYGSWGWKP